MIGVTVSGKQPMKKRFDSKYRPWDCDCPHPFWKGAKKIQAPHIKSCVDCGVERDK